MTKLQGFVEWQMLQAFMIKLIMSVRVSVEVVQYSSHAYALLSCTIPFQTFPRSSIRGTY